jgi:hypothetical protein
MQRNILSLHENPLYIGLPAVGPGLRPVLCLDVFSANPLYKPIAYNYEKTFLFLFLIPIKQFQKTKMQRNILSLHENPLYIGLPAVGPGLRPVLCLDVFSANPLYKQTNTTIQKHFYFCFSYQ